MNLISSITIHKISEITCGDLQKELSVQQQAGHSLQAAEALLKIALRKPDNQKYYYVPLLRVSSHESAA